MAHRRIAPALIVATCLLCTATAPARAQGAGPSRVPEARDFALIYRLDIPVDAPDFNAVPVSYALDASAGFGGHFDRVAYMLELDRAGAETQWIYASMAAFTDDVRRLGLPTVGSGAFFQTSVADLHVVSNVSGVIAGSGLAGNIEMWPYNYAPTNGAHLPGASGEAYDFSDKPAGDGAGYGSFQVHHTTAGQTLLAYNGWGVAGPPDIGIGNSPYGHPDWTFRQNAADYTARSLYVLVRPAAAPALRLSAPPTRAVYQRDGAGRATVPLAGTCRADVRTVEARLVPMPGDRAAATAWRAVASCDALGAFSGTLVAPAGWYRLEARARGDDAVLDSTAVDRVGIGEVFVTAGQSNAANHGSPPIAPADDRVSARGPHGWAWAADPQPIATGDAGSPWPALGDRLVAALDVPIGLISVAWGGTSVSQWQPGGALYPRLADALISLGPGGARAVLWHQGESDAALGTSRAAYVEGLAAVIARSRADAASAVPWGVARVGFVPGLAAAPIAEIVAAQSDVVATVPGVFAGPFTDDLVGVDWRHDGIHFNEPGLREHGRRWAEAILGAMVFPPAAPGPGRAWLPALLAWP